MNALAKWIVWSSK